MMKKRLLAILLAVSMIASGASASVVCAEDVSSVEEEIVVDNDNESDVTIDSTVENQENVEGEPEEGVVSDWTSDEQSIDVESEELMEEEIGESTNTNYESGYVTTMDENGNVYEVIAEDGDASDIAVPFGIATFAARSMSGKIVNFNTKGSGLTYYTEYGTGTAGYTCGAYGADAAYLGEEDGKVKFMLSGVIGLVSANEVQLVDVTAAKSISYYYVADSGRLYHYITTNVTNTSYASTLDNGKAPSYLKAGIKYYSYDGHYFYTIDKFSEMVADYNNGVRTNSVNPNSPYYNYFQYLPFRSQSNYSSSELNTMVNGRVSADSKMRDLGVTFTNCQNTYGTNALLMIGVAANESAWGMSNISQTKNNLFGLQAYDSSPTESAASYEDVNACVKDFSERYLSKGYLNPNDWRCHGAFLGNKGSGINVKYASDPYWGEKAANVAYSLDKNNGNKDYSKYTIGIKDILNSAHTNLNIRKEATTSSTALYTTKSASQYAFIILDQEKNYNGFYRVQSEPVLNSGRTAIDSSTGAYSFNNMYTYASTSYVTIVSKGTNSASSDVSTDVTPKINYTVYVNTKGWQSTVSDGAIGGTTGQSLAMGAIKISLSNAGYSGSVQYSGHIQDIGWQSWQSDGAVSGVTTGKRYEAIKIRLTGEMEKYYDIYYRVHVQNYGWLDWAKNGEAAGSSGYSYRLEAIQIKLVKKGASAPGATAKCYVEKPMSVSYSTHVQNIGWQSFVSDGTIAGTSGKSLRLEAIKIKLENKKYTGDIVYSTHIQNIGWQPSVMNGAISGTSGKSLRLEAIQIKLTGELAEHYDIYYRVHVQNFGWLDWAKNGANAGSAGYSYRLEAIQIKLVEKGGAAPGPTANTFYQK